jgi:hypothetical protein
LKTVLTNPLKITRGLVMKNKVSLSRRQSLLFASSG